MERMVFKGAHAPQESWRSDPERVTAVEEMMRRAVEAADKRVATADVEAHAEPKA